MINRKKKGFTIVELVIVIAVIGILSAVLIPVVSDLVYKAQVSYDSSLIVELNKALSFDSVDNGKHQTIHDALTATDEYGFNIQRINTKASENRILWDSVNDVFCYLKEGRVDYASAGISSANALEAGDYRLWTIASDIDPEYSTYLYNYTGNGVITTTKGLDVGTETVTSVTYNGSTTKKTVNIRTNGGTLTIVAPKDEVNHDGYADSVNVVDVATASYHERGEVKFLEVSAGHIVLEGDSVVSAIHFTATGEGEDAKFENAQGKKISIDLSNIDEEKMPTFSRDAVTIAENGTYVAEVKDETTQYIWLFGQGIKEQMVVTDSSSEIAEDGELKEGIEAGAEAGSVAEQIANPARRNNLGQLLDSQDNVIDLNAIDLTQADALDNKVEVEQIASKEDIQTGAVLFAGGTGTASDPFMIVDYDTFQNVSELYEEGYYYFKVKDGIETIDCKNWIPVNINGSLNGNNVKLINIDDRLFMNIGAKGLNGNVASWSTTPVTIENYDAYFKMEGNMDAAGGMAKQILGNNTTTLSNIKIYGQIVSGSNSGAMFSYTTGNPYDANQNVSQTILINDCYIYATLVSTSSSVAVVSGYPNYCNTNLVLTINNPETIWQGVASNPSGKIKFVTMSSWTIPTGGTPNQTLDCNKLSTVTLTKESNGTYTVGKSTNAVTVKTYISAQLTETDANGNQTAVAGITMAVEYLGETDLNTSTKVLDKFTSFEFHNKASESSAKIENEKLIVNIDGTNNFTFGTIKLVVVECDSNGNVLSYQVKNIVEKTINGSWTIK